MLKIYSDPGVMLPGNQPVEMLYPFWQRPADDPRDPNAGRYDKYIDIGRTLFEIKPLEEADLAVFPLPWEHVIHDGRAQLLAQQFGRAASRIGIPTVVFFWSDLADAVRLPGATVFRTSLYRSHRRPREFAMPAWSEDFATRYYSNEVPLRAYHEKPIIGFCGYAPPLDTSGLSWTERLRQWLRGQAYWLRKRLRLNRANHHFIRTAALRLFARERRIETQFIIRSLFWAGAISQDGTVNWLRLDQARREYVANMASCDYVLCVRGAGNFSYRLYEALSCGRIPVFVDTDCVLPYQELISWRDYCVWVDESELSQIARRVVEYHGAITPHEFQDRQRACRALWENFLSPAGFFQHFHEHFI